MLSEYIHSSQHVRPKSLLPTSNLTNFQTLSKSRLSKTSQQFSLCAAEHLPPEMPFDDLHVFVLYICQRVVGNCWVWVQVRRTSCKESRVHAAYIQALCFSNSNWYADRFMSPPIRTPASASLIRTTVITSNLVLFLYPPQTPGY